MAADISVSGFTKIYNKHMLCHTYIYDQLISSNHKELKHLEDLVLP